MQDLFEHDDITEVSQLKTMYDGYERFVELIDSTSVEDVILEPSAVADIDKDVLYIFPNPVRDRKIRIELNSRGLAYFDFEYQLIDVAGLVVMAGNLTPEIAFDMGVVTGVYFLQVFKDSRVAAIHPLIVLE
jgi:hypothetical protein